MKLKYVYLLIFHQPPSVEISPILKIIEMSSYVLYLFGNPMISGVE